MIDNATFGIRTAYTGTWVAAFVIQTGLVALTIIVGDTFGPTTTVRIAKVVWQTGAGTSSIALFAHSVRAAGRWITWLWYFVFGLSDC